jgi:hypothetical protein
MAFKSRIENTTAWRIDQDGFLRVTARILKAGVYKYGFADLPPEVQKHFAGKQAIMESIPQEEIEAPDALKSFEGKPIIRPKNPDKIAEMHDWRDSENAMKDGLTIGTVAGAPYADPSGMMCDLLIQDAQAIEDVKSGKLVEISAAYHSEIEPATGDDGQGANRADAVQRTLRGNHVLLLPEGIGRCGRECRILNTKGPETMFKVKIGNSGEFEFSTQQDADRATQLTQNACNTISAEKDEEKKKLVAEQKNALDAAHAEGSAHLGKFTELQKLCEALTAQVTQLSSEENQESVAAERGAYHQDEQNVVAAAPEPDKLKAAIGNCKSIAERKQAIVAHVMNARSQDASKLTPEAVKTAFDMLAYDAKNVPGRKFTLPDAPAGAGKTQRVQNADGTPKVHPYYRK